MGSAGIATLLSHTAFWILLLCGWLSEELGLRWIGVFLVMWLVGLVGLPYLPYGKAMFPPYVALLDVALVFAIFKGDVRLS